MFLSYRNIILVLTEGIEPSTLSTSRRHSTTELREHYLFLLPQVGVCLWQFGHRNLKLSG